MVATDNAVITEDEARKMVASLTDSEDGDWRSYSGPNCGHGTSYWFEGPEKQTAYVWCGSEGTPVMVDVWVDGHPLHIQTIFNR